MSCARRCARVGFFRSLSSSIVERGVGGMASYDGIDLRRLLCLLAQDELKLVRVIPPFIAPSTFVISLLQFISVARDARSLRSGRYGYRF